MDIYVKERMNLFIAFIISQLDLFANFKYFIRIPKKKSVSKILMRSEFKVAKTLK